MSKTKRNSVFVEELKKLCKIHNVSTFVACVCKQEDKEHGVHRMVFYGNRKHVEEIMGDMQEMFIEIGIGQQKEEEEQKETASNSFIYA